jgi:hypothetical protein
MMLWVVNHNGNIFKFSSKHYIGGNGSESNMKYGSIQVAPRSGMSLVNAKAIVQKCKYYMA